MSVPEEQLKLTVEEYLKMEETSEIKHEFVGGLVFAMSGSTYKHNVISLNVASALRSRLKNSGCTVFINDYKVRVDETNCFYYPDVLVGCGKADQSSVFTKTPFMIFEVLSRSTAAIDRREKWISYQTIESLNEYLIIHQSKMMVERYFRNSDGSWIKQEYSSPDEVLTLNVTFDVSLSLSMQEVYEEIDLDPEPSFAIREDSEVIYSW